MMPPPGDVSRGRRVVVCGAQAFGAVILIPAAELEITCHRCGGALKSRSGMGRRRSSGGALRDAALPTFATATGDPPGLKPGGAYTLLKRQQLLIRKLTGYMMMSMMIMTMMTMGNDSDYYNSGERYSDYDDDDEGDYDDEDEGDCDGDCDGDDAVDDDAAFLSESQKCTIQAAQQFTLRSPATGLGEGGRSGSSSIASGAPRH